MLRTTFALSLIVLTAFTALSFAEQPEGELGDAPDDMVVSPLFGMYDPRWEPQKPTGLLFSWSSASLGIRVQTSCGLLFRRSMEDAYAVILFDCQGFSSADAIIWIFSDLGEVLWGVYDVEDESVVGAMQEANRYFASPSEAGPAGKLAVWDGTFETDRADVSSWGRIKAALRP